MKKVMSFFVAALICAVPFAVQAENQPAAAPAAMPPQAQKLAETVSLVTGVAISPLMGVSAVGAWQYFSAKTPEQKAALPWFSSPLFWLPALLLVAACFVKDTAGTMLPTAVKKPLDVADTVENKISGLVATGAFVPFVTSIFHAPGGDSALLSALGFAAIDMHWLYNIFIVPVAMIAFFIVFMASNAINILILLSPFTTVDAALKGFRAAILATVAGSAWVNPWLGAAWALAIILISYLIAGWSFRLSHFGLVFVWDFFTRRCRRFMPDKIANKMFLARKINKVPSRTYGKLCRDGKGHLVLRYRPWLVLPERILVLPEGKYAVGKGLFYSEILHTEGEIVRSAFLLPPRYRSHEEELVGIYGFTDVRDTGLRATWRWIRGLLGMKQRPSAG